MELISQGCLSSQSDMVACSCNCLKALLTFTFSLSFQKNCIDTLAVLFERASEFMTLQQVTFKAIVDCISAVSKSLIAWVEKNPSLLETVIPLYINSQQSSSEVLIRICKNTIESLFENCKSLPSSLLQIMMDYLLSELNTLSNDSSLNQLCVCVYNSELIL